MRRRPSHVVPFFPDHDPGPLVSCLPTAKAPSNKKTKKRVVARTENKFVLATSVGENTVHYGLCWTTSPEVGRGGSAAGARRRGMAAVIVGTPSNRPTLSMDPSTPRPPPSPARPSCCAARLRELVFITISSQHPVLANRAGGSLGGSQAVTARGISFVEFCVHALDLFHFLRRLSARRAKSAIPAFAVAAFRSCLSSSCQMDAQDAVPRGGHSCGVSGQSF